MSIKYAGKRLTIHAGVNKFGALSITTKNAPITIDTKSKFVGLKSAFVNTKDYPDIDNTLAEAGIAKHLGGGKYIDGYTYPLMVFNTNAIA